MDWLEDGIVDFISSVYEGLFHGFGSIMAMAKLSPAEFNPTLWSAVTNFNTKAVLPIAWTVMSLFLMMELISYFKRSDTRGFKGLEGVYWVGIIFLKIGIAKLLMDNIDMIINAIFAACTQIITNGSNLTVTDKTIDSNKLTDALEGESIVTLLGYMIESLLVRLTAEVCFLLTKIVVQLRFIEIYVFSAIAALPFATLVSEEYSQIGKAFIKRMTALGLHAIFIIVVLYMYSVLLNSTTFNVSDGNVTDAMWEACGYSILCVIALFQTGGWSKSLCQAN